MQEPPRIDDLKPMLLEEVRTPFTDSAWGFELKFDGYRLLASAGAVGVQLRSKKGADATRWFPEIASVLKTVDGPGLIADGEVCVLDDIGRSDFDRMHARALRRGYKAGMDVVTFCIFDVLVSEGQSVMQLPLIERKSLLAPLRGLPNILVVDYIPTEGEWLFQKALGLQLEGIVAKRLDAPYVPGARSRAWLKIKRKGAVPAGRFSRRCG
jgi:bifunctional non-homologous end joining protein LigD